MILMDLLSKGKKERFQCSLCSTLVREDVKKKLRCQD